MYRFLQIYDSDFLGVHGSPRPSLLTFFKNRKTPVYRSWDAQSNSMRAFAISSVVAQLVVTRMR